MPDVPRAQSGGLDALTDESPAPAEPSAAPPGPETRLRARTVVRTALRILRERPRRVIGTAAVVFGTTAWISAVIEVEIVEASAPIEIDALASIFAAAVSGYGIVFYAGLLDLVLRSYLDGEADVPLDTALSRLPLTRLLLADLALIALSAIGIFLLVIPGIIVFTLLCLVGPIIVSEDLRVVPALKRSARLVKPHFWMTFFLVTIPFTIEDQLLHGIDLSIFDHRLIGAFCVSAAIGATVGATVGLLEVVLAHELREHEKDPAAPHHRRLRRRRGRQRAETATT